MPKKPPKGNRASDALPTTDLVRVEAAIVTVCDERVILDSDLAALYGVETKRLNEQVKRNAARFGPRYAFQLTKEEFAALRSQIATSKAGRGGRRHPPWAFTEHGVVMAATVLNSEKAIKASKLVVEVFVELRRRLARGETNLALPVRAGDTQETAIERISGLGQGLGARLQRALDHVLDSIVDPRQQTTAREEAQHLISESIQYLKDRLKKQGLENEEIAARVTKLLAQAEKERALTAKTRAETEAIQLTTNARKLRLLLEAQQMMEQGSLDGFLAVLKELSNR